MVYQAVVILTRHVEHGRHGKQKPYHHAEKARPPLPAREALNWQRRSRSKPQLPSQPNSPNSKTIAIKQQLFPARQVTSVADSWHISLNWPKAKTKIKTKRKQTKAFCYILRVNTRDIGDVFRSGLGPVTTQSKDKAFESVCTSKRTPKAADGESKFKFHRLGTAALVKPVSLRPTSFIV